MRVVNLPVQYDVGNDRITDDVMPQINIQLTDDNV